MTDQRVDEALEELKDTATFFTTPNWQGIARAFLLILWYWVRHKS
jgi:hypothetical protein